jgi:type I restriction enzyme R subunit
MRPEDLARRSIDSQLIASGWVVQDYADLDLDAGLGVAIREYPLAAGFADYMLFIARKAAGALEAKKVGFSLSGVAEQSEKYLVGLPPFVPCWASPLPFAYESTGMETLFRDLRDPDSRSRRVFSFHGPETLLEWLEQQDTLRARLKSLSPLDAKGLRACQVEAIGGLERSLADNRPRALLQMATGSGKTYTAVTSSYRLIKFGGARRILFLVDRRNLGRQTLREFQQYVAPGDGRKFTELYNVQLLTGRTVDPVSKVVITTIQRLYAMLRGEDIDDEADEHSLYELGGLDRGPKDVAYNPAVPPEMFDFIITDECHRSIYNLWRQVLEYFDAFLIGLTATPGKQTLGFFNQNLVTEYSHERAVADSVNVGYDVYRIKTKVTEQGATVEAGQVVDKRNRLTRKLRWEVLDDDLEYKPGELDRSVVAIDQIRTVIQTFRDRLFTDLFPGRREVPKTLIFAKDDSHAEDIVAIIREEFGKGNEFCKKITYRTTGEKPEDLITAFRNSYHPRVAVTVDMISTGTDIRPLECLVFMRDVKSRVYFDQMKGRGTRIIDSTELQGVTPDAESKTHFVLVDAVGVTESDKGDSRPLERKPTVTFEKLLIQVAQGARDDDTLSSVANRLARLGRTLSEKGHRQVREASGGKDLRQLANRLLDAMDPDVIEKHAQETWGITHPTPEDLSRAREDLAQEACKPFSSPTLRHVLADLQKQAEQTIDTVTQDEVIQAGYDDDKAQGVARSFRQFIDEHKDEITALQIIYSHPHSGRQVTYEQIRQLAEALERPPWHLTTEAVWGAFEKLEQARVRGTGPVGLLTNIVSLVRFATGQSEVLEPYPAVVEQRFQAWLARQRAAGREYTEEQLEWLHMVKEHIATSLAMEPEDLEYAPFAQRGGLMKARKVFGPKFREVLEELNEVLVA